MSRVSFVAGASVALVLSAAGWNVLQSAPVHPVAADQLLGVAHMAALVASNGSLIRGVGATSSVRIGPGDYVVTFDRSIANCHFSAISSNTAPGDTVYAEVVFGRYRANLNELQLTAYGISPYGPGDAGINALVFCPK